MLVKVSVVGLLLLSFCAMPSTGKSFMLWSAGRDLRDMVSSLTLVSLILEKSSLALRAVAKAGMQDPENSPATEGVRGELLSHLDQLEQHVGDEKGHGRGLKGKKGGKKKGGMMKKKGGNIKKQVKKLVLATNANTALTNRNSGTCSYTNQSSDVHLSTSSV